MTVAGLQLGAPGIYRAPERVEPSFQPVRLDVAGFVGVAPRGPVDQPVAVQSWSDYQRRFGGFAGPGRLPYAVQAFFAQGGAKAYVVRVGPLAAAEAARARHRLGFGVEVAARDEGTWGDRLSVRVDFTTAQAFHGMVDGTDLPVPDGVRLPVGSLLRLRGPGLPPAGVFRWVVDLEERPLPAGGRRPVAVLDSPWTGAADVAVVTATVTVADADPEFARAERFTGLGLRVEHPQFVGAVMAGSSVLVEPAGNWPPLLPADPLLPSIASTLIQTGADRYDGITAASFFDDSLECADDPLDELPHRGVDALARVEEVALLAVPDLGWRWPEGLLDGREPDQLDELVNRQLDLVARAERRRRFVVLLDVPSRLSMRAIALWRARFDSTYAAAYHPWLGVARTDDPLHRVILVPPSAFAAGIVAVRERRLGIPFGPANELAAGAVTASDPVTDAEHDQLHGLCVNVYRAERDGFRLSAARTLGSDPAYRQLSVRRLVMMLRLALARQAQWIVFEPSTPALQSMLRHSLTQFLRGLYRRGAFVGNTEQDAFFVRCDAALNPPASLALGRLIAEVGIAPAEPVEFIVLRIAQNADGVVSVEAERG